MWRSGPNSDSWLKPELDLRFMCAPFMLDDDFKLCDFSQEQLKGVTWWVGCGQDKPFSCGCVARVEAFAIATDGAVVGVPFGPTCPHVDVFVTGLTGRREKPRFNFEFMTKA